MSYTMFLHAMTPFQFQRPHSKRDFYKQYKKEVDHVLNIADVDQDGSIDFNEFFFFVLVHQIPTKYIETAFYKAGDTMTAAEFAKVLEVNRKKILFG